MTLEEVIRCHHELVLMMGYPNVRHGKGPKYTYEIFVADMNAVIPGCVRNYQQMKDVMRGKTKPPAVWQIICDELLKLAIAGETHPPTPGPMWCRNVPTKQQRRLAATQLDRWIVALDAKPSRVARASQMSAARLHKIRNAETAILPTELERLAAAFGKTREEFLRGPE